MRRSTALVLTAVIASLPACTSSAGTSTQAPSRPATTAASSRPATTAASSRPATTAPSLPAATAIPNSVTRRREVTLTTCRSDPGGWAAAGTAVNPGSTPTTYVITVFFTTTKGTVIGYARASARTPGHGRAAWRATGHFAAPSTTLCVLRGVG